MKHFYVLWVLVALLAASSAVALVRVQDAQLEVKGVQSHQNAALHSIICFVEYREKTTLTGEQRTQAVAFWAAALKRAHLAPCTP